MAPASDLLPDVPDRAAYRAVYLLDEVWLPAIEAIRRRHALPRPLERAPPGSNLVWYAGASVVIKLFPPLFASDFGIEREALALAYGRLGARTPEVLHAGRLETWPYLVLERVPGTPAAEAWPRVPGPDRLRIAREAGAVLRRFQALPLDDPSKHTAAWASFVRTQTQRAAVREDLPPVLREEVSSFLAGLALEPGPGFRPRRLLADLTSDHLLLVERGGRWSVASVIDLADATVGDVRYDLVAPGLTLAFGDAELQAALLEGAEVELEADGRSEVLLGWTLLHRWLDFGDWAAGRAAVRGAESLSALAQTLWPAG